MKRKNKLNGEKYEFKKNNLKYFKKGAIAGLLVSFGFLGAIAIFFYFLATSQPIENYIGESQIKLLIQAKEAEKAQLYIEQSAKLSTIQAVYDLSLNSSECGSYYGFSLWGNQTTSCIPDEKTIEKNLKSKINEKINELFSKYTVLPLPKNNYAISLSKKDYLKVFGSASQPLTISFGASTFPVCIGGDISKLKGQIEKCLAYKDLFSQYMNKNKLSNLDLLFLMSISEQESGCDPEINAGGILQVDEPCLMATPQAIRRDPTQMQNWACPTVEKQIDEGTKILYAAYKEFKDMKPAEAMALTLYAYNRGVPTANKAKSYYKSGISLKEAMFKSCVEVYGPDSTSKLAPGKMTWSEYFNMLKQSDPKRYAAFENSIDYYCIATGPAYPEAVFKKYKTACEQIGGRIVETGASSGTYSITPNFKVETTYDLNEYDLIKTDLNSILKDIRDKGCLALSGSEATACIRNNLGKKQNFEWNYNCLPEVQRVLYDFVESIELCNKNGICNIQKPETEKEYEIILAKENDKIIAKLNKQTYETKIKNIGSTGDTLDKLASCEKELKFTISKNKIKIKGSCTLYSPDFEYTTSMPLFVKDDFIYVISDKLKKPEEAFNYNFYSPKGLLKLCAISNYKNYFYDDYDKTTKERNIVYRIAAFAGDLEYPDPVQNLNVIDTEKAENNGTITFDENKAEKDKDVDHYNIYYSENLFNDASQAKFLTSVKDDNDPDNNGYKITIKLDDGKYYFAVTAVDTSGNENKTVIAKEGILIDDLNPGIAELSAEKSGADISFKITRPYENEDGTEIQAGPGGLKKYKLYKFNPSEGVCNKPSVSSIVFMASMEWDSLPTMEKKITPAEANMCYLVVADDAQEEPLTDQRYSEKSIAGPI